MAIDSNGLSGALRFDHSTKLRPRNYIVGQFHDDNGSGRLRGRKLGLYTAETKSLVLEEDPKFPGGVIPSMVSESDH